MPERLLSYREVARRLDCHRTTVDRWVRIGIFPAPFRIGTETQRFRESEVDAWIARLAGEDAPCGDSGSADDGNPAAGAAGA